MNDVVEFTFYPVGGFTNPGINKSVDCPKNGRPRGWPTHAARSADAPVAKPFDLPDPGCSGDKYEACLMNVSSCAGNTCSPARQLGLSSFLDCFEGRHGSSLADADGCAKSAGFDVTKVRSCYDDPSAKETVWSILQAATRAKRGTLTCFPWVEVDGQVLTGNCFGPDAATWPLLDDLCRRAVTRGIRAPAACPTPLVV